MSKEFRKVVFRVLNVFISVIFVRLKFECVIYNGVDSRFEGEEK